MRELLVTGSNGFVGSYFINKYEDKYDIKTFSFRKDDFATLDCSEVDVLFHLSALVHQMGGASEEEYERVNVTQTLDLAKKAKVSGVGHFIFMSTVKVYGEETSVGLPRFARNDGESSCNNGESSCNDGGVGLPCFARNDGDRRTCNDGESSCNDAYDENSECLPQDDYGKSKLKAEKELLKLEDDSFRVSIIRTPIVYGYGVKANIKNLVNLVNKVPILPFGGIDNKRSMVYVGNLCHLVDVLIGLRDRLDCRASLAMTGEEFGMTEGLDCRASLAMTGEEFGMTEGMDCRASLAMTGEKLAMTGEELVMTGSIFLASDDEAVSTTRLIELIAKGLSKKVYLVKVPFFESFLKLVKPSFHKRLYGSLEVDNALTKEKLNLKNPYSLEEGIELMLNG